MSHKDIKAISDAYLSIYESEEQLDEARPVRTMSAKDLNKKIDTLEDTHEAILSSLIDSVPEDYPVRKRQKLEKDLNAAYQKYFDTLSQAAKVLS